MNLKDQTTDETSLHHHHHNHQHQHHHWAFTAFLLLLFLLLLQWTINKCELFLFINKSSSVGQQQLHHIVLRGSKLWKGRGTFFLFWWWWWGGGYFWCEGETLSKILRTSKRCLFRPLRKHFMVKVYTFYYIKIVEL